MLVHDLAVTVDFYRTVLGFDVVAAPGESCYDWALLKQGDVELLFQHADFVLRDMGTYMVPPASLVQFRLYVPNVVSYYQHVRNHTEVVHDLDDAPQDAPEFSIRDCNGFILTFTEAAGHE